jgi:uncharacterized protein YutD
LIEDADLEEVENHIDRGDQEKLSNVLENIEQTVSDSDFEDSFKGVFSQNTLPKKQIQRLQEFIQELTSASGQYVA